MTWDWWEKIVYLTILYTEEGCFRLESRGGGLGILRTQRHAQVVDSSSFTPWLPSSYSTWLNKKNRQGYLVYRQMLNKSVSLSVRLSLMIFRPSVRPSICQLFVCLTVCLPICLFARPPVRLSVRLSVRPSFCPSARPSVYLCLCVVLLSGLCVHF